MNEIFQNNGTEKEQRNRSSQEQAALLKRRIEEMKKKQTILYMNPMGGSSKQSDDECYAEIMEACNRFLKTDSLEDEIELSKSNDKENILPIDIQSEENNTIEKGLTLVKKIPVKK